MNTTSGFQYYWHTAKTHSWGYNYKMPHTRMESDLLPTAQTDKIVIVMCLMTMLSNSNYYAGACCSKLVTLLVNVS